MTMQLIWAVSITWRRKITLMLLFGGAVFVMLAGIIRAVVILKVNDALKHPSLTLPGY